MKSKKYDIFIASSWKQRKRVRKLAEGLRELDFSVYDFTDPACRETQELPPERYKNYLYDPKKHLDYWEYLSLLPEWRDAVEENRRHLDECETLILLLPCGRDATADWAYAVGRGKRTCIVGHPLKSEQDLVHLWANFGFKDEKEFFSNLRLTSGKK